MAAAIKTPGVYIKELNAFPNSVVEVPTAVPAFIGYTETIPPGPNTPTRLSSFAEYQNLFGGAPQTKFKFKDARTAPEVDPDTQFLLYSSIRLFFDNGGGPCWICSIGTYDQVWQAGKKKEDFTNVLTDLEKYQEPTMLVAPDAVLLEQPDWQNVCQKFLEHCGKMQSRVSILDVYDGDQERTYKDDDVISDFRNAITSDFLNYGQAYYPWVNTSIVDEADVDYSVFTDDDTNGTLKTLKQALNDSIAAVAEPARTAVSVLIAQMTPAKAKLKLQNTAAKLEDPYKTNIAKLIEDWTKSPDATDKKSALDTAVGTLPDFKDLNDAITKFTAAPTDANAQTAVMNEVNKLTDPQKKATLKALMGDVTTTAAGSDAKAKKEATDALTAAGNNLNQKAALTALISDVVTKRGDLFGPLETAGSNISDATQKTSVTGAIDAWKKAPGDATKMKALLDATKALPDTQQATFGPLINSTNAAILGGIPNLTQVHRSLRLVSPVYLKTMTDVRKKLNCLPPSGGMAGVYTRVDNTIGVFKAPANTGMVSVISAAVDITSADQEDLNMPLDGKAINAIRAFPGRGVLIWGARTLDGNSQDWRYINVRRTIIMLEQSIKYATLAYVFEPNVASTWVTIKNMITNFLTNQWKAGALAGAKPEEAFSVDVGLGSTMTPDDILNGFMNVMVKVALVRPAEFIVITFQQKMQTS
jgi:phage tail sheath protein FI